MSLLTLLGGGGIGVAGPPPAVSVTVEFSPTTNPLATPVWVDITSHVRFSPGVTINRGRSSELDSFTAGRASLVLNNRARIFDPTYTAGPYYGNLKPLRRFRIQATYQGLTYHLFNGYCEGWPQEYDVSDREAVVPIQMFDALGMLALTNGGDNFFTLDSATLGVLDQDRLAGTDGAIVEELSGERVERILDINGWPTDQSAISAGKSLVSADFPSGAALSYLQKVERSEDGFLYAAANGFITFLDRHARQTVTRINTSQATFDDDGTDLRYTSIAYSFDSDNLYNDIRLTGDSDVVTAVEDSASILSYFRRTLSDTILTLPDLVVTDLAALKLSRYKEPVTRCPQITVDPRRDPANLFPAVLGRELLDRVTVRRTAMDVGTVNEAEQLIEGIVHKFNLKDWTTTFQLSPGYITSMFTLDSATLGVLDDDLVGA